MREFRWLRKDIVGNVRNREVIAKLRANINDDTRILLNHNCKKSHTEKVKKLAKRRNNSPPIFTTSKSTASLSDVVTDVSESHIMGKCCSIYGEFFKNIEINRIHTD